MSLRNGWSGGVWLPLVMTGLLTGCSAGLAKKTPPPNPTLVERYEALLGDADAARLQGEIDRAIALNREANKIRPTEAEPWRRVAQLEFARRNYSAAIASALEVTRRDENDPMANSILLVGGLRVATAAMEHLRDADRLPGSAKPDAQALTRTLRERLGEQVLVPSSEPAIPRTSTRPGPASRSKPNVSRPVRESNGAQAASESNPLPSVNPRVPSLPRPSEARPAIQRPGSGSPFSILE